MNRLRLKWQKHTHKTKEGGRGKNRDEDKEGKIRGSREMKSKKTNKKNTVCLVCMIRTLPFFVFSTKTWQEVGRFVSARNVEQYSEPELQPLALPIGRFGVPRQAFACTRVEIGLGCGEGLTNLFWAAHCKLPLMVATFPVTHAYVSGILLMPTGDPWHVHGPEST